MGSDAPIPRSLCVAIRLDSCAIVVPAPDDPHVIFLHDGIFHPGNRIRTEGFEKFVKKGATFAFFLSKHTLVFGAAKDHTTVTYDEEGVEKMKHAELDLESSHSI